MGCTLHYTTRYGNMQDGPFRYLWRDPVEYPLILKDDKYRDLKATF